MAGFEMADHPMTSKMLAFADQVYPQAWLRVTDGSIKPGDILVYTHSREELARQKQAFGKSEVGHVVVVVSVERRIVVGSHGRESTPDGVRPGAGYRRLLRGWEHWTKGRTLQAIYRMKAV